MCENPKTPPLNLLRDLGRSRRFGKGSLLASEGDPIDAFWLVESGTLRVYHLSMDAREVEIGRYGPGSLVGTAIAFSRRSFPWFVEAIEESQVLALPREASWNRVVSDPELAGFFLRSLSARCHALQEAACEMRTMSMRDRLLLQLAKDCGKDGKCHISLRPKKDLASALGTTPETLSRLLRTLVEEGVIAMEGRSIRVLECGRGCRGERAARGNAGPSTTASTSSAA